MFAHFTLFGLHTQYWLGLAYTTNHYPHPTPTSFKVLTGSARIWKSGLKRVGGNYLLPPVATPLDKYLYTRNKHPNCCVSLWQTCQNFLDLLTVAWPLQRITTKQDRNNTLTADRVGAVWVTWPLLKFWSSLLIFWIKFVTQIDHVKY